MFCSADTRNTDDDDDRAPPTPKRLRTSDFGGDIRYFLGAGGGVAAAAAKGRPPVPTAAVPLAVAVAQPALENISSFARPTMHRLVPENAVARVVEQATLDTHYIISKKNIPDESLQWHRQWLTLQRRAFQVTPGGNKGGRKNAKKTASSQQQQNKKTKKKKNAIPLDDEQLEEEDVVGADVSEQEEGEVRSYIETDETFIVPRAYGLSRWGRPVRDDTVVGPHRLDHVAFVGQLLTERPNQVEILQELVTYFVDTPRSLRSGILKLPTGSGKTVLMMALIATLKVPTLILVHRSALLRQTCKRIQKFLPSARVGVLQGKKCQVKGKDIVVGMLHSLGQKEYSREILDHFGFVIVDEVHNVIAQTFLTALQKLRPRYLLGVSATPRRKDGLSDMLHWYFGPIIVERKRDWIPVHVRRILYKRGKTKYSQNANRVYALNRIAGDAARNAYILDLIVALLVDTQVKRRRHVLVLSDRLEQLELLQLGIINAMSRHLLLQHDGRYQPHRNIEALRGRSTDPVAVDAIAAIASGADPSLPPKDVFAVARYVGGITPAEQEAAEKCDVILATYGVARDGIDIQELDVLVYGTPRSDVEQASGRILRPFVDKNVPVIMDIVDEGEMTEGMWWRRQQYYKSEDMLVKWLDVV